MKKIQIGARVNEEDAEFLNLLEINGATTPNDKLRAIIEEARLFESLLHLELSTQGNSYTPGVFRDHVSSLAELIRIIHTTSQKEEG